ncbi:MAG: phage holin family protein [Anaerolineales bacterium]|jgi:putative membrane protein
MKLILRILINAVAIWLTSLLLPGFNFSGDVLSLIVVAIIFGLVNALVRPIVKLLTLPITLITLGLFTLVVNALMLILTIWISGSLSLGGGILQNFVIAIVAAIIISVISIILSWILPD